MSIYSLPLRFLLPFLIIVFGVVVSVLSYTNSIAPAMSRIEQHYKTVTVLHLDQAQGLIQRNLRSGTTDNVQQYISSFGAKENIDSVVVVNQVGIVTASTSLKLIGSASKDLVLEVDVQKIGEVKRKGESLTFLSDDGMSIYGIASVCGPSQSVRLREQSCGFVYIAETLAIEKRQTVALLRRQATYNALGIFLTAIFMALSFKWLLTDRVTKLLRVTENFRSGIIDSRSALKGKDELATISKAIDGMLDQISDSQTELKKALHDLGISESRFKISQRFANIGTWDWNIKSGDLYWSAQISALFGGEEEYLETSYDNFLAAIHPEDRDMVVSAINSCIENNNEYDIEHRVVWPDGSVRWLHESGDVIRDEDGIPLNMLGVVQDMTAQKEAEKKIILAREKAIIALEEAKTANSASNAKSEFLASMSHEIRTPLNAIIGFAEALKMGVAADDKDERNERLEIIANSGRQLNNLISDILDFSKVEAGKLEFRAEAVLPSDVFESCLPIIRQLAESNNITFQYIKKSNIKILVDPARLQQILINFISNAVKYNKPNGSIEFGCYETSDNYLRIYVEDTGVGIPKEKEGLIFSHFDRINQSNSGIEGIGLGLAICKKLTEMMNGIIGYETTLGKGSTFWVEFPIPDVQNSE